MSAKEENRRSVVTIGAYDGVHLGHRRVIETVRGRALEQGLRSVVVTFDRHPASVVRPESAPRLLTDLEQKLELLGALGVDDVEVVHFDEERATETAEDFVEDVLVGQLSARLVVVGSDFHFGKGRGGNVALLEEMGKSRGFEVVPFQLVEDEARHETVSSTRIRKLIGERQLEEAAALLSRPHEVRARVEEQLPGQVTLSVPSEILLPPAGVYEVTLSDMTCLAKVLDAGLRHSAEDRQLLVVTSPGSLPEPGTVVKIAFLRPDVPV